MEGHEAHTEEDAFRRLYAFLLFTAALWISGKLFARLGMPALIGEITVGIIAGPHVKNLVPETNALILQGEIALVLWHALAFLNCDTCWSLSKFESSPNWVSTHSTEWSCCPSHAIYLAG